MIDIHSHPICVSIAPARLIEFYTRLLTRRAFRLTEPNGRIGHAEIKIGPATVMWRTSFRKHASADLARSRKPPFRFSDRADVDKGSRGRQRPVPRSFSLWEPVYGKRSGKVRDPFGHEWLLVVIGDRDAGRNAAPIYALFMSSAQQRPVERQDIAVPLGLVPTGLPDGSHRCRIIEAHPSSWPK